MKKIYSYALATLMVLVGVAVFAPANASAAAVFNNHAFGIDCPTVAVANATTGTPTDSNNCWTTSTSASSGDIVNVILYYHNNSSETANNVVARLSPQSPSSSSSLNFTGSISASNASTVTGNGTISLSVPQGATFGTVKWYKDKQGSASALPNGQTGAELFTTGLNLGNVLGYDNGCPITAGVRDAACHEGWLMVSYRIGQTVTTPCTVDMSATPMVLQGSGTANLTWTSSNCTSVTVTGPNGTISTTATGQTSQLVSQTSTFNIVGYGTSGQTSDAVTVTVNPIQSTVCTANLSPMGTQQIQSGQTATLSWSSTGTSYVTVSGPNGIVSQSAQGTIQTAPIYGSMVYTLVAGCNGASNVSQTVTFTAYNANNGTAPTATTLAANTSTDGSTATLNGYINSNTTCGSGFWNTNCSNVTYYFKYGASQYGLNSQTAIQTMNVASGNVSAYLTGLQANTTYYFQLVASNTYGTTYGSTLSFVTTNGVSNISAITTTPTNVTASSARLNGLVSGTNGQLFSGAVSVYFDYGTSPVLGLRTSAQTVNISGISNYFDTIATSANTTYYYRIVAVVNGQTYPGSTVSFTTPGFVTTTNTNTNTNTTNTTTTVISRVGTGGGSAFLQLAITDQVQSVFPGDTLNYVVTYQNISGVTLSNVTINVILPTGVTFRQASQGLLTTNNTVAIALGTLLPVAQGTINIQVLTSPTIMPGNNLVTTATAAFTLPSNAQDSAIAYDLDNVTSVQNNLAGLALFGNGFFPTTLLGWILLLGLLLILILITRYFYNRAESQRHVSVPVTHVQYETPTSANTHTGYHGNNLPH